MRSGPRGNSALLLECVQPARAALEKQMSAHATRWLRWLVIILLGNGLYFAFLPYLPPPAQRHWSPFDLGTVVDFWFCLIVFGVFELISYLHSNRNKTRQG